MTDDVKEEEESVTVSEAGGPAGEGAPPREPRSRGWLSLYFLGFLLVIVAGAALGASAIGFLSSTRLLWASIWLSGAAIISAIAGALLPRR